MARDGAEPRLYTDNSPQPPKPRPTQKRFAKPGLVSQRRFFGRRLGRDRLRFEQRQLLLREAGFVLVIGADDSLHQVMTNHIAFVEVDEGEAVYALQDVDRLDQAAAAGARQIDLRNVPGDHRLGIKAEASDEHLHLLGGGVLRLVEDD